MWPFHILECPKKFFFVTTLIKLPKGLRDLIIYNRLAPETMLLKKKSCWLPVTLYAKTCIPLGHNFCCVEHNLAIVFAHNYNLLNKCYISKCPQMLKTYQI